MNKLIKNSLGLAQIPLMIMLLLMAIAVPVATKLVQDSADNRNLAVGGGVGKVITTKPKVTAPKLQDVKPGKDPGENVSSPEELAGLPTIVPMGDRGSNPPKTCASMSGVSDGSACYAAGCNWEASVKICSGTYPTNKPFVTVKPTEAFNGIVCCKIGTGVAFQTDETDCRTRAGTIMGDKTCGNGVELNVTPKPTLGTAYDSCLITNAGDTAFCCKEYPNSKCSTSSGGSSSGGAPIATATKKPSSGGNNNGGTTTNNGCVEECPGSDGVLRNCTNTNFVNSQSKCETAGRPEMCGGSCYVCPSVGGAWTKQSDLSKCTTVATGSDSILNYKVAFGGVIASSSQCVKSWPLQFIVLGGGESKSYTSVLPESVTTVGNKLVFSGSLTLTGFNKTTGIAVFIKGPKSLQMKYGINNQTSTYDKAGGELTLTSVKSTSPTYDFSGYPLLPGDTVGTSSEIQDGWVNGVDFAYVKSKSLLHETVENGGYLKGDLDGNCQVNSNDVNLLKITLQEKQGQLY